MTIAERGQPMALCPSCKEAADLPDLLSIAARRMCVRCAGETPTRAIRVKDAPARAFPAWTLSVGRDPEPRRARRARRELHPHRRRSRVIQLGDLAKDRISGFVGICTGRGEYLYGCVQVLLAPQEVREGKVVESTWFDEDRCEVVKAKKMAKPATADERKGGPSINPLPPGRR